MKNTFVISCPIDTYSGYGNRSRDLVKSIIELDKYDVKIIPQRWGMCPYGYLDDHEEWSFLKEYIVTSQLPSQPDIWMQITVPNEFQPIGKYNIGVSAVVETTACHQTWIEGCNRMDLILVSSNHSKEVLINSKFNRVDNRTQQPAGVLELQKPVEVLFEGVNIDLFKPLKKEEVKLDLSYIKENWCYLFVGHWMQGEFGEDRKNVGLLVKSFYETFKNQKKAPALILKTSRGGGSKIDRREIMNKINQLKKTCNAHTLPSVYLIHGELTENEMNDLYNHPKIKAMACFTKGEGFGRPLLEFSLVNKPIITTKWSGHLDFLNPEYTSLINGDVKQIHPSAVVKDILIPESGWFAPNANEINHYFKDVFKKYKHYKEKSNRQGYQSRTNFNFDKMKEELNNLIQKHLPEIPKEVPLNLPPLPKLELPKLKKV